MPSYPPQFVPKFDIAIAGGAGVDAPSATEIASELFNAAESINQCITFVRALATVDQKFRPATFVGSFEAERVRFTATAAQTNFDFSGTITVDPTTATVDVYADGVLIDPSSVTLNAGSVDVPAQTVGTVVVVNLHDNSASLLAQLQSIAANLGASMIGVEDAAGVYAASNVEEALREVREALETFIGLVGDLSTYFLVDGSRSLTGAMDAGANRLTNIADGVDPQDAVALNQIQSLIDNLTNLEEFFLLLTGGVMAGPINMNLNRVVNLPDPTGSRDAVNLQTLTAQINSALAAVGGDLDSYLDRVTPGAAGMERVLPLNSNQVSDLPAASETGQAVEYTQWDDRATAMQADIDALDGLPGTLRFLFLEAAVSEGAAGASETLILTGTIFESSAGAEGIIPCGYDEWGWTPEVGSFNNGWEIIKPAARFTQMVVSIDGSVDTAEQSAAWAGNLTRVEDAGGSWMLYFDNVDFRVSLDANVIPPSWPMAVSKTSSTYLLVARVEGDPGEWAQIEVRAGPGTGGLQFRVSHANNDTRDTSIARVAIGFRGWVP